VILQHFRVRNFRCHEDTTLDELGRLVVVVGENDVGKTALMDAICTALGVRPCGPDDYRQTGADQRVDRLSFEVEFQIEEHDQVPPEFRSGADGGVLKFERVFLLNGGDQTHVHGLGFADERLDEVNFSTAETQKQVLKAYGIEPAKKKEDRYPQREELLQSGRVDRVPRLLAVQNFRTRLGPLMPHVERISATEFASPASVVQRTLQAIARMVIHPVGEDGIERERPDLQQVRTDVQSALNQEIEKAIAVLEQLFPDMEPLRVEPQIDFVRAVGTSELLVQEPEGARKLSAYGAGRNRKTWMGLLHWERESAQRRGVAGHSVLRVYDEPDVNLDYSAQRDLFGTIQGWATDPSAKAQCIVCTHAVTMIDRAPLPAVRFVRSTDGGRREVQRVLGAGAAEQNRLLHEIGLAVGLTNTVLLYERAFLVFEGPSEGAALPLLYKQLHGFGMREDGIVPVQLEGCGGWKSVLDVLLRNRAELVHVLLDEDTRGPGSVGGITRAALEDIGFPAKFLETQVTYIGEREFEDAFTDDVLACALNQVAARVDERPWSPDDVQTIRAEKGKFSSALTKAATAACIPAHRQSARSKPEIATAVARCCGPDDVPEKIVAVFTELRRIARLRG
jgi:putative ATP-dependent endonuclease of the OLD family